MKDTKRTFAYFKFYDRDGMQSYLEKMAEKGWLFTQSTEYSWNFRRIEPKKLHFSVVYFPRESMFAPGMSEKLTRFHEFCAHTGWKLASSNAQVQFFYNEAEDPVPIETDAVLEVENIHQAVKKRFLPGYFVELLIAVFNLVIQIMQCADKPISYLSSWGNLVYLLCWGVIGILALTELIGYFLWHKKAKKTAVEENRFRKPSGHPEHMLFIIPTLFLGFGCFIASHVDQGLALPAALASMGGLLLACAIALFCFLGLLRLLKKCRMPACASRIISILGTAIGCFLISIPLMSFVIDCFTDSARERAKEAAVAYEYEGRTYYAYQDELPLTVSDLTETEYTGYSRTCYTSKTMLLSLLEGRERPRWDALAEPDLEYRIVEVKAPFLYDLCLNSMLADFAHSYGIPEDSAPDWAKALLTDAAPWGAKSVYRLALDTEIQNRYLLCYEDYIVEIDFDWVVTTEQMRIVTETIQSLKK